MVQGFTKHAAGALALGLAVLLTACGGGGDDDDADVGPLPVRPVTGSEGLWVGTASTGYDVRLAILNTGELWGVYSRGNVVHGAVHGTSVASGGGAATGSAAGTVGRLRGSAADFSIERGQTITTAFEGTFVPRRDIQIGFAFDAFSGNYHASYEQPASLAQLAGVYLGQTAGAPSPLRLHLSPLGAVVSEPVDGCVASGSVAPRPGGRNVLDLRLTFAGEACPLGHNALVTGIAQLDGNGQLLMLGTTPLQTDFFVFLGQR